MNTLHALLQIIDRDLNLQGKALTFTEKPANSPPFSEWCRVAFVVLSLCHCRPDYLRVSVSLFVLSCARGGFCQALFPIRIVQFARGCSRQYRPFCSMGRVRYSCAVRQARFLGGDDMDARPRFRTGFCPPVVASVDSCAQRQHRGCRLEPCRMLAWCKPRADAGHAPTAVRWLQPWAGSSHLHAGYMACG